ncbi:MAG TPA: outer membrane protein assembly factor BamB [Permianibacter sp.]|nr:outer membrane protein assembly factor BamB [Permianibacter sp.]
MTVTKPIKLLPTLAFAFGAALLAGCASDEDEVVIAPVPDFAPQFEPKTVWTKTVTTTVGEDIALSAGAFWRTIWPWADAPDGDRPISEGFPANLQPVLYGDRIFVANSEGLLLALNQDGSESWRFWLGTRLSGGMAAGGGYLVVGTPEGVVLAIDTETGEEKWRNYVSSEVVAPPAVGEGLTVVRTVDGKLFALDLESGERKWFSDRNVPVLTQRGTSSPFIGGGITLAGFDNGKVAAFRLDNGQPLWEKRVGQPTGRSEIERIADVDTDPVIFGSVMYVASVNGSVLAVDLRNGETLWQRELSTYRNLAVDAQMVYASNAQGHLVALDRRNGFVLWTQKALENRQLSAPAALGDYVVVGDLEGYLHFMKREDGAFVAQVEVDDDGLQAPPQVLDKQLLVYDRDDTLHLFALP